ncbi:uncharacterized protein LOC119432453 [Dermacentor silvarum]|uniref:uncharacterized protein LOC119432453 n=1 Tax=Dermacentor silvarum TaxID=543639 RepID=UPI001896E8B7|nr:uncharacterized protein LOC119432453 [Dermacentor silvarum]
MSGEKIQTENEFMRAMLQYGEEHDGVSLSDGMAFSVIKDILTKLEPEEYEYAGWATVSDVHECSSVVREVFSSNGTIADAAVSALLCMSVAAPHLLGLGGGFLALYYDDERDTVEALNALGMSPANVANVDQEAAKRGAKASIVPGALRGYQELHKKLNGTMKWRTSSLPRSSWPRKAFPSRNTSQTSWQSMQRKYRPLTSSPYSTVYNRQVTSLCSRKWQNCWRSFRREARIISTLKSPKKLSKAWDQGFAELVKEISSSIIAGKVATKSNYTIVEDYGGVHLSITKDFKALTIISGINEPFGSKKASVPGLIMNNYMSAFAAAANAPNGLQGGKQPRTSMVPVFLKHDEQRLLLLQAGNGGGIPGMWALIQVLGCISERNVSFCVRSENRILPALPSSPDKGPDIQPTASGIFTKGPLVSWLVPSDDVHCDGTSDGEETTAATKWAAIETKDYCKRTKVCGGHKAVFDKEVAKWTGLINVVLQEAAISRQALLQTDSVTVNLQLQTLSELILEPIRRGTLKEETPAKKVSLV